MSIVVLVKPVISVATTDFAPDVRPRSQGDFLYWERVAFSDQRAGQLCVLIACIYVHRVVALEEAVVTLESFKGYSEGKESA